MVSLTDIQEQFNNLEKREAHIYHSMHDILTRLVQMRAELIQHFGNDRLTSEGNVIEKVENIASTLQGILVYVNATFREMQEDEGLPEQCKKNLRKVVVKLQDIQRGIPESRLRQVFQVELSLLEKDI